MLLLHNSTQAKQSLGFPIVHESGDFIDFVVGAARLATMLDLTQFNTWGCGFALQKDPNESSWPTLVRTWEKMLSTFSAVNSPSMRPDFWQKQLNRAISISCWHCVPSSGFCGFLNEAKAEYVLETSVLSSAQKKTMRKRLVFTSIQVDSQNYLGANYDNLLKIALNQLKI